MTAVDTGRLDLTALYGAQWRPMVRLAVLLVDDRSQAEDVVQDAFIGLHRRQDSLRSAEAAVAYLRTSTVNGSRSVLRHRGVMRRHLIRESAQVVSVEDTSATAAEHADLLAAVRRLPRRQREVLVLRYWSHLSEREIADTLGVSAGTVKSTASRALNTLQTTLGDAR